jgi:hypothetical protein
MWQANSVIWCYLMTVAKIAKQLGQGGNNNYWMAKTLFETICNDNFSQ